MGSYAVGFIFYTLTSPRTLTLSGGFCWSLSKRLAENFIHDIQIRRSDKKILQKGVGTMMMGVIRKTGQHNYIVNWLNYFLSLFF